MPSHIVTFVSDFGHEDWFVGVVHGVVLEVAPQAHVVDLNHLVPPGNVARAAFLVEAAAPDFAPGTIHLAVVDPGVGTDRRALVVAARGQYFIGPDNGVLEWALGADDAVVHAITELRYLRTPLSRTFHGRDVFGPVAGHLALGVAPDAFGPRITDPIRLPVARPHRDGAGLTGRIVFIDRFGNALTNVTEAALAEALGDGLPAERVRVSLLNRSIDGLSRSYGDAPVGTLIAVMGSSGRLEIAQVGGDAAVRLGLGEGDPITVTRREPPGS